jgi:hypothetical protein
MLTLPLEPTSPHASPVFKDATSCAHWLSQLQLTNLQHAHSQLLTQLDEFNCYAMRGIERFNTLEVLRETLCHVQDDFSKKLIAKPLPLNENELLIFQAIVQLWQSLLQGYRRCLQAYMDGERALSKYGALLCQRCLIYSGKEIFEHLRTGYEFAPQLWRQLHELYAYAEAKSLHEIEVSDPTGDTPQARSSCVNSYVKTLLACYAYPAQLTRWQLQHLDCWLTQWSNIVHVVSTYQIGADEAHPLAVDLSGTIGLQPIDELSHHDAMRYLVMAPLENLLRVKTTLLQQGETPQQLDLGDHYDSQACIELLNFLHQSWCENLRKRRDARKPIARNADLCYKPEGIYAHLSGKPFKPREGYMQARAAATMSGSELQEAHNKELVEMGYPLENWQMENESVMGARLSRVDKIGGRFNYKQLIGLRPNDAQSFILGTTAWANVSQSGRLQMGIKYLPGRPEPVSVRTSDLSPKAAELHAPAFLLPELPTLKIRTSLIIPRDWFHVDRLLELFYMNGYKCYIRLDFSIERGPDYERVSFTPV